MSRAAARRAVETSTSKPAPGPRLVDSPAPALFLFHVTGYHTGDFIGRQIPAAGEKWGLRTFEVVDPLRPVPETLCPFPQCSLEDGHDGDHVPCERPIRRGVIVEVWDHPSVSIVPIAQQGGAA